MKFYHETLIPQVNALKTRSYYIPFSSENFSLDKEKSERVTLLKRWRFAYYPRFTEDVLKAEPKDVFDVPFMWQLKGFDYNQYTNFFYPIPYDPPFVRKDNPCGLYKTDYFADDLAEKHYIVFDGADSCLYLFVNGVQAGYSTVSHSSAEFDITDYLKAGRNELTVLVFKWCAGTYLEDQDKIRMSGIFRDVYVIRRPKDHISDYKITTDTDGCGGRISFRCDKEASVRLYDGALLLSEKKGAEIAFELAKAKLWNAETPKLYRMVISYNGEYIEEYVGIRRIEIEGSVFTINGRPVKFKGVNRHSMTTEGYVESLELMRKDFEMFAEYNINAVRTSHYPPHPIFTKLCDVYGIYVLEEADIESHGLETIHYCGDPSHFDDLANDENWREVYLHRQERMYERDKNRPCVVIWSLGNEAGWGTNFKACSEYLHSADDRPVHYEGNTTRNLPETEWRDEEYLDVASMMYTSVGECRRRIEKGLGRPFMLCEYTHAMGNSCGDVKGYWDYIYEEEKFCGAFVWEWCNHTVRTADGKYLYGGDFGETEPCSRYDGNFCVDGLVDTDRRPHPSVYELKQVYAPVDVQYEDGRFTVVNRYDFLSLDNLTCRVIRMVNGEETERFEADISGIPARGSRSFDIPAGKSDGYETLDFRFFDRNGNEKALRQIILSDDLPSSGADGGAAETERAGEEIRIKGETYTAVIDRRGMLSSVFAGAELLKAPAELCLYREPIDNDLPFIGEWQRLRLQYAKAWATEIAVSGNTVKAVGKIFSDIVEPLYDFEITYTAEAKKLKVLCRAKKREWVTQVARFGFKFVLDGGLNQAEYFGRGPGEAYADRLMNCSVGRYSADVKSMNFDYIKMQDSGSRCDCRRVALCGGEGSFTVESRRNFCFTASPYDISDYRRHNFEMDPNTGKTVLNVDYKTTGVGSAACGAALEEKYTVNDERIEFGFDIIPCGKQADGGPKIRRT